MTLDLPPDTASFATHEWPLPLLTSWQWQGVAILVAAIILLIFSGRVVRLFVGAAPAPKSAPFRFDPGAVIGKCENILVFILAIIP